MAETAQSHDKSRYGHLHLVETQPVASTTAPDQAPSVGSTVADRYNQIRGELSELMAGYYKSERHQGRPNSLAEQALGALAIHRARLITATEQEQNLAADMAESGDRFGEQVFKGLNKRNREMQWDQVIGLDGIWRELHLQPNETRALRAFRQGAEKYLNPKRRDDA